MTQTRGIALLLALACLAGCYTHPRDEDGPAERLTVGKVQGEIKVGMSGAAVAELLGSPNIVTTDEQRREVWIYDRVSSDRIDTVNSSAGGVLLVFWSAGSQSQSTRVQKTLTVIIKFDEQKLVRDFAYNYTQF